MTIHLPGDLEDSLRAEVSSGRFTSLDEAVAAAVRLLLRDRARGELSARQDVGPGSIGAMADSADELDEIVADAYRKRREEAWRDVSIE